MDIRQSVYGEVAIHSGAHVTGVDLATLLRRLLLFDSVIIRSIRLREIRPLVRAFGKDGLLQLLRSGILKISCEWTTIIIDIARNGVRELPLAQFSFGIVDVPNRQAVLRSELSSLEGLPGLGNSDRDALGEEVISSLVRPPAEFGEKLLSQFESDIRSNSQTLSAAIEARLRKQLKGRAIPQFEVRVEEPRDRIFQIITNLGTALEQPHDSIHRDFLQPAVSAVANLNHRLATMEAYSAITGFAADEAPLLFGRLANILRPLNPTPIEDRFARVITIANLPDLSSAGKINVERLLEARESRECRDFRCWLSKIGDASDAEIAAMVDGLRKKIGFFVRTDIGKALRLAVTTAIGLIPGAGLLAGPAAGAIDSFLVERVLPTTGVFAFLNETYPSLFESA